MDCLQFEGSFLTGVEPNCPFVDQIQIAAYAYDDGNAPSSSNNLLAEFSTSLTV